MPALPEPMLARSGRLPDEDGYAYEPKWDGFRAIVRCGGEFRVRSRRGWNMTSRLPELAALPVDAVLDGELVALGDDGWPRAVAKRLRASYRPGERGWVKVKNSGIGAIRWSERRPSAL